MFRKWTSVMLALVMVLSLGAAIAEDDPAILTDMMGREINLDAPAQRIVALTPSDCEILYELGAGDLIVGRGEYCDYPSEVLDVPSVQSGMETNLEQIIALEPDVVVMATMAQTEEQVNALEEAGITVVVSDAQNIEGVYTAIELLGVLTDTEGEADRLIGDMKAAFDQIASMAEKTDKTIYFEVSPLQYGLWAAGGNTFMDELAAMCGVKNVFGDLDPWAEVSEEQVIAADPDYIVTTTMYFGEGPKPEDEIASRKGWENMKAIVNGQIFNADNNEITRPGPRLINAANALLDFISGEASEEEAPAEEAAEEEQPAA